MGNDGLHRRGINVRPIEQNLARIYSLDPLAVNRIARGIYISGRLGVRDQIIQLLRVLDASRQQDFKADSSRSRTAPMLSNGEGIGPRAESLAQPSPRYHREIEKSVEQSRLTTVVVAD